LIVAAFLGEAGQGGAVQLLASRLDLAAVGRHGGGCHPQRGSDDCDRLHVFLSFVFPLPYGAIAIARS
jgi:hypothetical protein